MPTLKQQSEWIEEVTLLMEEHPKGKPLTRDGMEFPNPQPLDPPAGYRAQPSMFDVVREMVRKERLQAVLDAEGLESPEDADDFDVGDDYEPHSPHEYNFDHVADPAVLQRLRGEIDRRERELRGEKVPASYPDLPSRQQTGAGEGGSAAGGGGTPSSEAAPSAAGAPPSGSGG